MRHFARLAACALACTAAPALAQPDPDGHTAGSHADDAAPPPLYVPGPGPGTAPADDRYDHRPVWKEDRQPPMGERMGDGPRVMMDPRARDAWLDDCHRTMRRKHASRCEAYLDDYYGYYERAYADADYYAARTAPVARPEDCVETVVTEDPAPVIRRHIPRRAPARRDKRIRVN